MTARTSNQTSQKSRVVDVPAKMIEADAGAQVARDEAREAHEEEREHRPVHPLRDAVLPGAEERKATCPPSSCPTGRTLIIVTNIPAQAGVSDRGEHDVHAVGNGRREDAVERAS